MLQAVEATVGAGLGVESLESCQILASKTLGHLTPIAGKMHRTTPQKQHI